MITQQVFCPTNMPEFDWDRGLDYAQTREKLRLKMEEIRPEVPADLIPKKRLAQYSILLTQLVNATRVSEAFDGVHGWAVSGLREQQVNVRKRGKVMKCLECNGVYSMRSTDHGPKKHTKLSGHNKFSEPYEKPDPRLVVIPPECLQSDLPYVREAFDRGISVDSTKMFALRQMHFNTHSLRYAQISHLTEEGKPAQMVAKITHHKSMDFILHYTQQKAADAELRKQVSGQ
jgi:hypothetical protein